MKINSEDVVSVLKISKLSSYKIAQDTGISGQTIQNYRDGKTKPSGANLTILSKYLGIDLNAKPPYPENGHVDVIEEGKVECLLCKKKQEEIQNWKDKHHEICEELRVLNQKYNRILEELLDSKKETPVESSKKTG